ncbi:trigger factor, partial [Blautia pseudococcoides]|nr:trigger factor [Blautia pseudococcoides]
LQQSLIVQAIFDAEKVEISVKDYEAELEKFAKDYGFKDTAALESAYSDEVMVKANVLWSRSCEILQETAKVTDVAADAQSTGGGEEKNE